MHWRKTGKIKPSLQGQRICTDEGGMYLEKWYADWVDGCGQPHILYRARLRWGSVSLGYSAALEQQRQARIVWGGGRMPWPRVDADAVHWPRANHAGGHAHWRWHGAQPASHTLWQQQNQSVVWEPVVCNGPVYAPDGTCQGRGYAERLTLNVAPWKLGLRTLQWGRFCGARHSLIWIAWQGAHPLQQALLNGRADAVCHIGGDGISTATARLALHAAQPIVHESLGAGALHPLAGLRRLATPDFLAGVESKWAAPATLYLHGQAADTGHAIYEEVRWP